MSGHNIAIHIPVNGNNGPGWILPPHLLAVPVVTQAGYITQSIYGSLQPALCPGGIEAAAGISPDVRGNCSVRALHAGDIVVGISGYGASIPQRAYAAHRVACTIVKGCGNRPEVILPACFLALGIAGNAYRGSIRVLQGTKGVI